MYSWWWYTNDNTVLCRALREKIKNYMLQEHTDFDDSTINDEGFKDLKVEEDKKA